MAIGKPQHFDHLWSQQIHSPWESFFKNRFPTSNAPQNPDVSRHFWPVRLEKLYTRQLSEYAHVPKQSDKFESWKDGPDDHAGVLGHKIHLNVSSKRAPEVSRYLVGENYMHKFLVSEDLIRTGRMFTVYFGSKDTADRWSPRLSQDLGGLLAFPANTSEVEYAPNVVGRFLDKSTPVHWDVDMLRGIQLFNTHLSISHRNRARQPRIPRSIRLVFEECYSLLSQQYGAFFFGS